MKKILSFLLVTMMLLSFFTGCSTKNEIPDVVKNMKGGEKWETKIDYANTDNWLAINDTGKDVDVIYFYPTTFTKARLRRKVLPRGYRFHAVFFILIIF